jgi:RNA polymerase sigma-70 factor (ECF subfamily)
MSEHLALPRPDSEEQGANLRDAVDRLPEEHREVLVMTYWEDLTAPEVAAMLGVSATAVRSRLVRARRLLKTQLNEAPTMARQEVNRHE